MLVYVPFFGDISMTYYYQELTDSELDTIDDYDADDEIEYADISDFVSLGGSDE